MKKRQKIARTLMFSLVSVFFSIVAFTKGREVSFQTQWPLYEALRNTSGIVFAVMGAWIAIIYPEAFRSLSSSNDEGKKNILNMLQAMSISALILAFILVVALCVPLMKQFSVLNDYVKPLRGVSYTFVSILTVAQLWTILLTILPNYLVKRDLVSEERKVSFMREMEGNKRKK
jgi:uncharacterized membrane protein (UPF0182 family)